MKPLRIFVVDDSVVVRRLLHQVLDAEPDLEPAASAPNGRVALSQLQSVAVDAVVLDVEMPIMGGLETLSAIRRTHPRLPVIMFSSLTHDGAKTSVEALMRGATDCVVKPSHTRDRADALAQIRKTLVPKLKSLRASVSSPSPAASPSGRADQPTPTPLRKRAPSNMRRSAGGAIAIGSSTGGPNALAQVIADLGRAFEVPIAITQHMPPLFTEMLAQRLDKVTDLSVHEAKTGDVLRAGTVLVAPGDHHLVFVRKGPDVVAQLNQDPPENSCRPAVDVMFRSLSRCFGADLVTVVLTGMGSDGLAGVQLARRAGATCIVQDEATSTVWGMPGAIVQAGLADQTLPLGEIGGAIRALGRGRARSRREAAGVVAGGSRR